MSRIATPKSFVSFNTSFNRKAWSDITTTINAAVNQIAVDSENNIYAAGDFTSINGTSANRVAKWNGTSWSAMGSGVDGQVLSILVDNSDNVYVGGFLTNNLARWDGSSWIAIGASLGTYVESLATDRANNIYAGGPFGVRVWNGSTWTNLTPTFSGSIFTIYHDPDPNGEMYVGGFFSNINGVPANNIARFQETTWFPLGTTINNYNGVDGFVFSIAKTSSNIFTIGGLFNFATQSTGSVVIVNNICQWISNLFYPIEQGGISGANDAVYAIVSDVSQNAIYVVGDFSQFTNVAASSIASIESGSVKNLGSPFQSFVNSIIIDTNNNVFANGSDSGVRKISKYSNQTVTSTFILPIDNKYKQIS